MPEELKLTALEKRALDQGLATQRVRMKGGRIIWDNITKDLPQITGNPNIDADRLLAFKNKAARCPCYHILALKEWLRAQIESGYDDVLGSNTAQSEQIEIYKMHLDILSI